MVITILTDEENIKVRNILERMYQLNGDDTFSNLVSNMWNILKIKGSYNVIAFEASLIKMIQCFLGIRDNNTAKPTIQKAKKHDLLLLMFGLLDGYYHTELDDSGDWITITADERVSRYVEKSDYSNLRPKEL